MRALSIAATFAAWCIGTTIACAQSSPPATPKPVESASPSPSATPTTPPVYSGTFRGSNVFLDQTTQGPGAAPPEGPGFAAGSPLSPISPYDWLSSAPVTPGVAGAAQYAYDATYRTKRLAFDATLNLAAVSGSLTNLAYWGEPLQPALDPHRGSTILPLNIAFPTHAGEDDASALILNLARGSIASADGSWKLRGGYLDLEQTDAFVFTPPALTSVTPSLGATTAETLGPGIPTIDAWGTNPTSLPLLGVDGVAKHKQLSLELTDALLPALPNTGARLTMASLVLDHGESGRFSAQVAHVRTFGAPIATTTLFGINPTLTNGPQGELPTSTLADQRQTIAGIRAFVHPLAGYDALLELGRAWYDASLVALPGTSKPGDFVHASLARHLGTDDAVSVEYVRFDPHYATTILPYGTPENIWSSAWSWPGPWLKSNYQLADNTAVGINRGGYRVKYDHQRGRFEAHTRYAHYQQLVPATTDVSNETGFVEGFFLPQQPGTGTRGSQTQLAGWFGYHLDRTDVTLDVVADAQHRAATLGAPQDVV